MNGPSYKVTVARDLEDLIPVFMGNRKKELDTLRVALAAADFEQLRQLGHRMKGVGNSYGFARAAGARAGGIPGAGRRRRSRHGRVPRAPAAERGAGGRDRARQRRGDG